jgi:hypothetical protein
MIMGIVAVAAALSILSSTMLSNHRPLIRNLTADAEWTTPLSSLQLTCTAADPDGDELSYGWSATGGGVVGEGATVSWSAPDSADYYYVTVIVTDGRGGETRDDVLVVVRDNTSPTIDSLRADSEWTVPSGSLEVTCTASDPDAETLSYDWTAAAGDISGTGATVNWTAPQEVGLYNVTVVVKDGHGGRDAMSVPLSVVTGDPPLIVKLVVTPQEAKYLKATSSGYTVGRTKQYDIGCIVSDTGGGASYNWSCESGAISGEGPVITWTAPDQSLARTEVAVVVSDVYGNMVTQSIVFRVASCTPCTFG